MHDHSYDPGHHGLLDMVQECFGMSHQTSAITHALDVVDNWIHPHQNDLAPLSPHVDDPTHSDPSHTDPNHSNSEHHSEQRDAPQYSTPWDAHHAVVSDRTSGSTDALGANFDPNHAFTVIGDPAHEMENWHQQAHDDTCAVVSQEFVLDSLTGHHFSEDELRQEAYQNGWYQPGGGTPLDHVGDLVEAHGFPVDRTHNASLNDMASHLANGDKIIVAVHAEDIWYPSQADSWQTMLNDFFGMPGQNANHAVEVIGVNTSDPNHPTVVLNDPGAPDGRGLEVPAEQFAHAWAASDNYMVSVSTPATSGQWT